MLLKLVNLGCNHNIGVIAFNVELDHYDHVQHFESDVMLSKNELEGVRQDI